MSIRVLMFGWEFPPHIAGGLGTACYGLTKGLANHDIQILFVMPKAGGDEDQSAVRIINASDVEMLEHIPGQNIRWENYKNLSARKKIQTRSLSRTSINSPVNTGQILWRKSPDTLWLPERLHHNNNLI